MNLSLSEEQVLIKESAEKFLGLNYSFEKRRVFLENIKESNSNNWKSFAELGWLGIGFSEKFGGFDGNINNLMTLMECLGSALVLEPLIFNNLISGKFFEKFFTENNNKYLKEIITGEKIYSLLFSPNEKYHKAILNDLKVEKNNSKLVIYGKCNFILGLNEFDYLLTPLSVDDKIRVYLLKKNIESFEIRNYETIDNIIASDIEFNSLELNEDDLLIELNKKEFFEKLDYIIDYATLSMCSQALGIIDKMYELTLEYCKTREQFGKKIGSFQVIQHRLVDMHIVKEEMRSLNYMAQLFMQEDKNRKKNISLNKIFLGTHAKKMSQDCVQLHGGMGVAKEMSIGHYFSKITTFCTLFGNTDYHKERYAIND